MFDMKAASLIYLKNSFRPGNEYLINIRLIYFHSLTQKLFSNSSIVLVSVLFNRRFK